MAKYVSGPYSQRQLITDIHEIEIALTERFLRSGAITDAAERNSWRDKVLEASNGRNTVMYDDQNNPSVMVLVPLATQGDLVSGAGPIPHQAFVVNGQTKPVLYVSKYQNFTVGSGATLRALSLKNVDPGASINFDNALLACKQKGAGWHLMTNAEWSAIALQSWARGFLPRGNNLYGKDYVVTSEKGVPSFFSSDNIGRVLTGSGPLAWTHDGTPYGIYDLNGNVWEWVGGLRLQNGEIQILVDNNAADNTKNQGASSTEWRAILEDGSLVAPGTVNTLKYDATGAGGTGSIIVKKAAMTNLDASTSTSAMYKDIVAQDTAIPNILKLLGLYPHDVNIPTGRVYARTGERLPYRGGHWAFASHAGAFALNLTSARSAVNTNIGFRCAYVL